MQYILVCIQATVVSYIQFFLYPYGSFTYFAIMQHDKILHNQHVFVCNTFVSPPVHYLFLIS